MKPAWKYSWEDYQMSKNLTDELKAFCKQYDEKKNKIVRGTAAEYTKAYERDIEAIEQAAIKANPEIKEYLIKSVAYDLPYELVEYDRNLGRIPVSRTVFYGYRRRFFYELHKLRCSSKKNEEK